MQRGIIFDIKKYSIHDGPGIRTTVFLSGCPLACLWCHNPESQSLRPTLLYRENRCLGCETCVEVCPEGAITVGRELEPRSSPGTQSSKNLDLLGDKKILLNREKCTNCQLCVDACYSGALEFSGKEMTVEGVLAQIEREIPFYDESGGGVTFSGGEPLMQPGFLTALLRACKAQEIQTCVDTSGFANWQVFEQIRGATDLFLYDLKHMDSVRHQAVTGVPNKPILENLRRLVAHGAQCLVRIPLIPGINDDQQNLRATGRFLAGLGTLQGVELMGYHDIAQAKYAALGREYALVGLQPPSTAALQTAADQLEAFGLSVKIS